MTKLIHSELSYAVRGVLFDVYNKLGPMLPEEFYQIAVEFALKEQNICCEREKPFEVYYLEARVGLYYVDHWIEDGKIVLEIKVAPKIIPIHRAQAISYLKVTNADVAFVVNYGATSLEIERLPNLLRKKKAEFKWEERSTLANALYPKLTNNLLKLLHGVHFELGPGFIHQVYRRATMIELSYQNFAYDYIKELPIYYKKHYIGTQQARLLLVDNKILVATFAVKDVDERMKEQMKSRLRQLGIQLGMLANFHRRVLQVTMVRVS